MLSLYKIDDQRSISVWCTFLFFFFFFWFAYAQMHNHNCVHTFLILELSVYRLNIVYYVQTIINDTSKTALNDINLNG